MLADFTPERVPVMHKGKPLMEVRGLNLEDISSLVARHMNDLRQLAGMYDEAKEEIFSTMMRDGFMLRVVMEVPTVASTIIALAADAPDSTEQIRTLPLAIQLLAMSEITRLTLEDVGGPKGLTALIRTLMQK